MGKLSEALTALIEKSDDLSTLPQLAAAAKALEDNDARQQETIGKLQETARKYLAMIPIPGQEPKQAEEQPLPTIKQLADAMVAEINGGK